MDRNAALEAGKRKLEAFRNAKKAKEQQQLQQHQGDQNVSASPPAPLPPPDEKQVAASPPPPPPPAQPTVPSTSYTSTSSVPSVNQASWAAAPWNGTSSGSAEGGLSSAFDPTPSTSSAPANRTWEVPQQQSAFSSTAQSTVSALGAPSLASAFGGADTDAQDPFASLHSIPPAAPAPVPEPSTSSQPSSHDPIPAPPGAPSQAQPLEASGPLDAQYTAQYSAADATASTSWQGSDYSQQQQQQQQEGGGGYYYDQTQPQDAAYYQGYYQQNGGYAYDQNGQPVYVDYGQQSLGYVQQADGSYVQEGGDYAAYYASYPQQQQPYGDANAQYAAYGQQGYYQDPSQQFAQSYDYSQGGGQSEQGHYQDPSQQHGQVPQAAPASYDAPTNAFAPSPASQDQHNHLQPPTPSQPSLADAFGSTSIAPPPTVNHLPENTLPPAQDPAASAASASTPSFLPSPPKAEPSPHPKEGPSPATTSLAPAVPSVSSFASSLASKFSAWTGGYKPSTLSVSYEPLEYRPPPSFEDPMKARRSSSDLASPSAVHRITEQRRDAQDQGILKRLKGAGASSAPSVPDTERNGTPSGGPGDQGVGNGQGRMGSPRATRASPSLAPVSDNGTLLDHTSSHFAPLSNSIAAAKQPPSLPYDELPTASHRPSHDGSHHSHPPTTTTASSLPQPDFRSLQQHIEALEEEKFELKRGLELQGKRIEELTLAADQAAEDANRHLRAAETVAEDLAALREAMRAQDLALAQAAAERDDARAALRESLDRCKNLANEVIGLEEQVRHLKADLYKSQAQAREVEARLSSSAREAEERLRESQKTIEFLKEQIDIQAQAYDERLASLRGSKAGSHQEFLLQQTIASLETRLKEAEQAAEVNLLAVQSAREREAAELKRRVAEAEAEVAAQRESGAREIEALRAECLRLEARLAVATEQAQQSASAAQQEAALKALEKDPLLKALVETLRPAVKGADASLTGEGLVNAVTGGAAAVAAKFAGKMEGFIPKDIAALLPDLTVPLTPELLAPTPSGAGVGPSLPAALSKNLSEEAVASAERIFAMLEELEEERTLLMTALERQKREREKLKLEIKALRAGGQAPSSGVSPIHSGSSVSVPSPSGSNSAPASAPRPQVQKSNSYYAPVPSANGGLGQGPPSRAPLREDSFEFRSDTEPPATNGVHANGLPVAREDAAAPQIVQQEKPRPSAGGGWGWFGLGRG